MTCGEINQCVADWMGYINGNWMFGGGIPEGGLFYKNCISAVWEARSNCCLVEQDPDDEEDSWLGS
jgi:hypothetical protein